MEGIDNNYIKNAIINLVSVIGVKNHVDDEKLISLVWSKKMKECIKEIAKDLGLPIEINLSYVPKGYKANNTNNFNSTHLVKTDWRGRGNEGIVAQVSIPSNLPLYGTTELNNFPISVKISENCTYYPSTFIAIMAHELSHIVLASLWHKEKDNEIYTDITAMILGFSAIMNNGRKVIKTTTTDNFFSTETKTNTTTYGYLSDEQFHFAYNKIEKILDEYKKNKNKLVKKIKELNKKLKKWKNKIFCFQKYLEHLDKNLNQKITQEDGFRISAFHQIGYMNEYEAIILTIENELKNFTSFIKSLNYYNKSYFHRIKEYEEKIKLLEYNLSSKYIKLTEDMNILKRYISFTYRLKLFIKILFRK